jgi:gamma-glutamylaminecyclotransferase
MLIVEKRDEWSYVFVYGTLKQGFCNYNRYLLPAIEMRKAIFLGAAQTLAPEYCLVVGIDAIPCMFYASKSEQMGYHITGELFYVDKDTLAALDLLEEVSENYYTRDEIEVQLLPKEDQQEGTTGTKIRSQVYIKPFDQELKTLVNIPEYKAEHHQSYAPESNIPDLDILQCLYGQDKIDFVREQLAQGISFEQAWQQMTSL